MKKIDILEIKNNFHKFAELNFRNSENFEYYILDKEYISKLEPFFDAVQKDILNKEIFFRNTLQENLDILERGGFFVAAFSNMELAGVISVDMAHGEKSLPTFMHLSPTDILKSVIIDTICTLPKYRGNSLQEKLMCICEYICLQKGHKYAFMSISPNNYYSVNNAFKQEYTIFAIEELYGDNQKAGLTRYILSLPLGKRLAKVKEQYSVINSNIDMQKEVIDLGFVGMKAINFTSVDKFFVSYSKAFYD